MLPPVLDSAARMESSMLIRVFLSSAFLVTISSFFCYICGFSKATICASICSSSPEGVIAKLMTDTFTKISGG